MHQVHRPCLRGIALAGAGIIAIAPVAAPPAMQHPAHAAVADHPQMELTALGVPDLALATQAIQLLLTAAPGAVEAFLGQLDDIADGTLPLDQAVIDTLGYARDGIDGTAVGVATLSVALTGAEHGDIDAIGFGDALVLAAATAMQQSLSWPAMPLEFAQAVSTGYDPLEIGRLMVLNEAVTPFFSSVELVGIGLNHDLPAPIGGDPDVGDSIDHGMVIPVVRRVQDVHVAIANFLVPPSQPFVQHINSSIDEDGAPVNSTEKVPERPRLPKLRGTVDKLVRSGRTTALGDGNKAIPVGARQPAGGATHNSSTRAGADVRAAVNDLGQGIRSGVKKLTRPGKVDAGRDDSSDAPSD
ncbi:hypothetical protein [Mycolicibacterium sp. HK-90]|uniref:hypothetical protein n=1 Tax=Mycolicibacterium sp. HK-90 TaxID=3056937 RepID=UPI002657DED6|nr:hypothetical protein [Mycolicibacterium sp. HK-90]WKG06155.1 hypothetical protein QU592_14225 [Mycolicibacterium sp. HK-90]